MSAELLLEARSLRIEAPGRTLVHDASFGVRAGELVALVGHSGSGKSVTARALLGLLPFFPGRVAGEVWVDGQPCKTEADFARVRGARVALVPQDGRGGLDPLWRVGRTIREAARLAGVDEDPLPWLEAAGFSTPGPVATCFPHELSGGMAQRAAIAAALARKSAVLIADECTSGLDVSVQRTVLQRLRKLADDGGGVLLITHDLRLLPGFADRIVVMDEGRTVEEAPRLEALVGAGRVLVEATRQIAGGRW